MSGKGGREVEMGLGWQGGDEGCAGREGGRRRTSPVDWMRAELSLDMGFDDMVGWMGGSVSVSGLRVIL